MKHQSRKYQDIESAIKMGGQEHEKVKLVLLVQLVLWVLLVYKNLTYRTNRTNKTNLYTHHPFAIHWSLNADYR